MRSRLLSLSVLAASVVLGCGGGASKPAAVPVTGKVVFRKMTPAAGAFVVFHPADPGYEKRVGGKPFATTADDGTFTLTTYATDDGAPEGEYGVTVEWRGKPKDAAKSLGVEGGAVSPSMIQAKYGDPRQPVLKATVKKDGPNAFTFDVD